MHASGTLEFDLMSKQELIHRIREVNRSARTEFLIAFNETELADYLHRLDGAGIAGEVPEQPLLFD
jgi:hypothetical protein